MSKQMKAAPAAGSLPPGMISRSLVRLINVQRNIDIHSFSYGNDISDTASWEAMLAELKSEAGSGSQKIPTAEQALARSYQTARGVIGTVHDGGWLVMTRHDSVDARSVQTHANDNMAELQRKQN